MLSLLSNCGSGRDADEIAGKYVRLAVALGERDPDGLDYFIGLPESVAETRLRPPRAQEISESAAALGARAAELPEGNADQKLRKDFLKAQLRALAARAEMLTGRTFTFDHEAQLLFGLSTPQTSQTNANAIRTRLSDLLNNPQNLAEAYERLDQSFLVPEDRLPEVMERALQMCRDQTIKHLTLPPGEHVRLEYVRNKPWSAFSAYKGNYQSVIQVNVSLGLTLDRALRLACHEGYPGHHVFNSLVDQRLVRDKGRIELSVQPVFSPQSLFSEAAATIAADLAFSGPERIAAEESLLSLAGLVNRDVPRYLAIEDLADALHPELQAIARDYADNRLEFVRALQALESRTLMTQGTQTLKYINEYRTYVLTYTEGRDRLADMLGNTAPEARWQRFADLIINTDRMPIR